MTISTPDSIEFMRAQDEIRRTVMTNSFAVEHDVDGIVQQLWASFGHFDWDVIDQDTDRFWAIVEHHRIEG